MRIEPMSAQNGLCGVLISLGNRSKSKAIGQSQIHDKKAITYLHKLVDIVYLQVKLKAQSKTAQLCPPPMMEHPDPSLPDSFLPPSSLSPVALQRYKF